VKSDYTTERIAGAGLLLAMLILGWLEWGWLRGSIVFLATVLGLAAVAVVILVRRRHSQSAAPND
jgi:hypothetical protein